MKKIISVACALAVTLAVSASVLASDYGAPPSYSLPAGVEYKESAPSKVVNPAGEVVEIPTISATVVSKSVITEAISSGAAVKMPSSSAVLKTSALTTLAKNAGATLTVVTSNYAVSINGKDISTPSEVNLSMSVKNSNNSIAISTKAKGDLGLKMSVTITDTKMSAAVLKKAKVYLITADGTIEELGPVAVDAEGNAVITMEKGGKYVISVNAPSA